MKEFGTIVYGATGYTGRLVCEYLNAQYGVNDEVKSMASDPTQPGEGPSKEERDSGHYDVLFVGSNDAGDSVRVGVTGDKDPGYGSTSKMIAESAVCLLQHPDLASGGIWTPAAAMGTQLIERLQQNAGLTFELENS